MCVLGSLAEADGEVVVGGVEDAVCVPVSSLGRHWQEEEVVSPETCQVLTVLLQVARVGWPKVERASLFRQPGDRKNRHADPHDLEIQQCHGAITENKPNGLVAQSGNVMPTGVASTAEAWTLPCCVPSRGSCRRERLRTCMPCGATVNQEHGHVRLVLAELVSQFGLLLQSLRGCGRLALLLTSLPGHCSD